MVVAGLIRHEDDDASSPGPYIPHMLLPLRHPLHIKLPVNEVGLHTCLVDRHAQLGQAARLGVWVILFLFTYGGSTCVTDYTYLLANMLPRSRSNVLLFQSSI